MKKNSVDQDTNHLGNEQDQRQTIRRAQQPNVIAQNEIAEATPVVDGKD